MKIYHKSNENYYKEKAMFVKHTIQGITEYLAIDIFKRNTQSKKWTKSFNSQVSKEVI